MTNELIYLATPYTDADPEVREKRFQVVNKIAAKLMANGNYVFSPISHTHPIALAGDLPGEWEYWEKYDRLILRFCTKLMVVCQKGWQESVGVRNEMNIAREMGIPVECIEVQ